MSSYEQFDDDKAGNDENCYQECIRRYHPKNDPLEFLSLVSLISLSVGIFLTMIGYLVPRDYDFDVNMEATEMEKIEMYYDNLAWNLDVCIIFGMGFVVVGGLILAGIICYLHVTSDFWGMLCGDTPEESVLPSDSKKQQDTELSKTTGISQGAGYQSTGS